MSSDIRHVVPRNDLVEHLLDEEGECICGPTCEIHVSEEHQDVHIFVHHALDGRA